MEQIIKNFNRKLEDQKNQEIIKLGNYKIKFSIIFIAIQTQCVIKLTQIFATPFVSLKTEKL